MKTVIGVVASCLLAGTALAEEFTAFNIDQGTTKVIFNENVSGHSIDYKLPKGCEKTKVETSEDKGVFTLTHSGEKCDEGAKVTLILGSEYADKPLKIEMKTGVLELPAEMKHYNKANVKVSAGAVDSTNLKSYCARKFPNPAAVTCSFVAATKAKGKFDLDATVKAGIIRM